MKAVQIENVEKRYQKDGADVHALKGVSFDIEQGEIFGLLGPNGAGKTTLISIMSGVTRKNSGEVKIFDTSIDVDITATKKMLGVVPQEISYDAFFTLDQALQFQFGYYGLPFDKKYLDETLERLALTDKRNVKPRMLSGGMKRRLMIARALLHKPKVVVLDEPTAGVDVELRHDMYDIIREMRDNGTTVILTSHYLEEVELLCERVAILNKGTLVALDHKEQLKNRFKSTRIFSLALAKEIGQIPETLKRFNPELKDGELQLQFEENEYQDVLSAVSAVALPVSHFRVIEPSLEDVFVSLTDDRHHHTK